MKNLDTVMDKMLLIQGEAGDLLVNPPEDIAVLQTEDGKNFSTKMDAHVESFLKRELSQSFPDIGFLGEETAAVGEKNRYVWIVDPIDGTSLFALGGEYWSNSIALADREQGKILLSSVMQPKMNRRFVRIGNEVSVESPGAPIIVLDYDTMGLKTIGFTTDSRTPYPSVTKALPEMEVCAFGTSKHYDRMPGIKDRLKSVYAKEMFPAFKREYGFIEARPGSGSSALYISDIADGRKHAALLFFQAAWDMAAAAPYARDAGCIVKCDTQDNPDIASWDEDIETVVSRCGKKDLLNVAVFANEHVEREVLRKYNA